MVRLKYILLFTAYMLCSSFSLYAYDFVVTDPKTTAVVTETMIAQSSIENMHNRTLDSINRMEKKIAEATLSIATIKEAYKYAMENIKGFGTESAYYKRIGMTAADIIVRVPKVISGISRSSMAGKVFAISEVSDLAIRTQQLAVDFVNIVNNGRISNPIKNGTGQIKKDGYNLLDRYDRLSVAIKICTDLNSIRNKLIIMEYMIANANWNSVFYKYDPKGWANIVTAKSKLSYMKVSAEWLLKSK